MLWNETDEAIAEFEVCMKSNAACASSLRPDSDGTPSMTQLGLILRLEINVSLNSTGAYL